MKEPARPGGGWTVGRVLGLIAGVIGTVGFGYMSLCGAFLAAVTNRPTSFIISWVAVGLVLTILSILLVRSMNRPARKAPRE